MNTFTNFLAPSPAAEIMGTEFTPIFLFVLVAIFIAVSMLGISAFFDPGRGRGTPTKQMPYESGMDPIGDARQRFDVRYYLVAIAFLLFDVELLFLYPWAVAQWSAGGSAATATLDDQDIRSVRDLNRPIRIDEGRQAGLPQTPRDGAQMATALGVGVPPEFRTIAFLGALVFIAILAVGFAYDWRKGVFEWR